jgi:hypothetical protein
LNNKIIQNTRIMNINIKPSRVCRPITRVSPLRRLALAVTVAALVASGSVFAQTIYWLSGSSGDEVRGSPENPATNWALKKNDTIILDANPSINPTYVPFTPWVATAPEITLGSTLINGASSPYIGYDTDGFDKGLYNTFTPYKRFHELIARDPSLVDMMPSFFTQSDPVYLRGAIVQSNEESPDFIKAASDSPYNVWPISIYSADALDAETGTPRLDMQNAAWVVLASSGDTPVQRARLMSYYGEYVPATGATGTREWDGSYSMITLEHVIFYGGNTTGGGGGIYFARTESIEGSSNTRAVVQIKGDFAVIGNMAATLGGGMQAQESFRFDGNVYFMGNYVGAAYSTADELYMFNRSGGTSYDGDGGAMRIGSGGQDVNFTRDAIFIGNLAAASGGAISFHNNSTVRFNGKTVFMGNQAGLFMKPSPVGSQGGNGGVIAFEATGNRAYFNGESYFIANEASGYGGALATGYADNTGNGFFYFTANAQFTDNVSGKNPEVSLIYSDTNSNKDANDQFQKPINIRTVGIDEKGVWSGETIINTFSGTLQVSGTSTDQLVYGSKVRGGGAVFLNGTYLLFDEKAGANFLRNSTNGVGGALMTVHDATTNPPNNIAGMSAVFYNNASFIGNVAAINGGAIQVGNYGPRPRTSTTLLQYDPDNYVPAEIYFGRGGAGSTLTMIGNIAYTAPTVVSTSPDASSSGTAFSITLSTGTTVRAADGTTAIDIPVLGGGAVFSIGGFYVESLYNISSNQTGGSGGAMLIGSGGILASATSVLNRGWGLYGLVLNALDWKEAGTYLPGGDSALLQNNVAVRDGGAIAAHDGAGIYIGSGAKFLDNYAGGEGGAIALAMTSGQSENRTGMGLLDLRARVADITFSGNRAGVDIDTSVVDLDKILDSTRTTASGISTEGYMDVDKASGHANDIYIGMNTTTGTLAPALVAYIRMNAYEGMKISLDGGIEMAHSGTNKASIDINTGMDESGTSIGSASITNVLLSNTTPVGTVVFDNASADFEGSTVIGNGTLRIQGTSGDLHWGSTANKTRADTIFFLGVQGPATLEANAIINAGTIGLGDGATLRVLGVGATHGATNASVGTLTLNSGTIIGLMYDSGTLVRSNISALTLAGNGRLNLGLDGLAASQLATISVGDIGHTVAQTLTIAKNATTLANIELNNATLLVGLYGGNLSDSVVAGNITLTGENRISLTSLASGIFNIATADGILSATDSYLFDYKGTDLSNINDRMKISAIASGKNLQLTFTTDNLVLNWSGASGTSWMMTSNNMLGDDTNHVFGDVVHFGVASAGTVSVDEYIKLSGLLVEGDYAFTGEYGVATQITAWNGSVNSMADGRLTMSGVGRTLTLGNANGAGQRNEFTDGILIQGGTVAVGTEAQLGVAFSQITFVNASGNGAALLITGNMLLNGATSLASQRLDVTAGNIATVATNADGIFNVINNTVSGNGGVFNVDAGSTLNLAAQGDMHFLYNKAAQGGALSLGNNAKVNFDVGTDIVVMFGLQSDRNLKTAANTSALDSIYGSASSIIEKNGAGLLSINSYSAGFDGTLNINAGKVALGEGTVFGSPASKINVDPGAWLGGAAIIGGDLSVNGGYLSIDTGGSPFSVASSGVRASSNVAQVLRVNGALSLENASLIFNVMANNSAEYSVDRISTGGPVSLLGSGTMDFNDLWQSGRMTLIDSGAQTISWVDTAPDITNGFVITLEKVFEDWDGDTLVSSTLAYDVSNAFVSSGTDLSDVSTLWSNEDIVRTKAGVILDERRYQTAVGYEMIATVITTTNTRLETSSTQTYFGDYLQDIPALLGEDEIVVSQTNFYDATKLVMDSNIKNMKLYWTGTWTDTGDPDTGSSGTTSWGSSTESWEIPGIDDKTFVNGDSIVFGSTNSSGDAYDGGYAANRTIDVDRNVWVADMTFTGSGNWSFGGAGRISTNAGANNYKDEDNIDLSTGQLLLDKSFTGTVTLTNDGVTFNGIYVDTGSGMAKTPDIDVQNGTLKASALILTGNLINNDSFLILDQPLNQDFKDTQIYGTGDIIQTGSEDSNYTMTLQETGIIRASNYWLERGTMQVKNINSVLVSGTLKVAAGATLLLDQGLTVGTLVNGGILRASSNSSAQNPPNDQIVVRDPVVGLSVIPIYGNFVSEDGTLELSTFRDAVAINNLFVAGQASGTSKVIVRNITSMGQMSTITTDTPEDISNTGTYAQPYGMARSVNQNLTPKRDTPVVTALGGARNLKLVMDWDNSVLASATIGALVPFLTRTDETYVVTTSSTITTTISGTDVSSSTLASSSTESLNVDPKTVHFYDEKGNIASLGTTGSTVLGSSTISTSGSMVMSGTTTVMDIIIVSSTYNVRSLSTDYAPSEIDYSESRDNYKLVQGRDGNWYFRNPSITPADVDLPLVGAAPIMADILAQGVTKAFYEHVNARHDTLKDGWITWANYTHSEDRFRREYFNNMMIKQDVFQVGADYAFVARDAGDAGDYSLTPSISFGGAYAFTSAEATRVQTTGNTEVEGYGWSNQSTLSASTNSLSAYASARWWRFYLDMILEYSPKATYKARLDARVPFDMDGTVKGSRVGASAELGIIINPMGLGQLEIYAQATGQKHDFDSISSISEPVELTNDEGYNPIYDPNSPNGRRYHFSSPTTFKGEGGLRWGSQLTVNEDLAVRPWGGIAYGRMMSNDYVIYLDEHGIRNDMRGNYYTFQGGVAALFRRNWQFYFTLGWTNGKPSNNYTLSTGAQYIW